MRISPLPSKGGGFYTADKHQQLHSMSNSVPSPSSSFSGEDAKSEPVMDSSVLTGVGTSSHLNGWEYLEGRETGYVMSREQNMLTNMKEEREDWEELNVKIENDDGVEDEEGFWKEEKNEMDEMEGITTDLKFVKDEVKIECGEQEGDEPSMFFTSGVLEQPGVPIYRLEIANNSVAVQSLPSAMSCEGSQGVRSPWNQHELSPLVSDGFLERESQVMTLDRWTDAQSEVSLNQLPSSSENGHGPKPAVPANCHHPQKTVFKCAEVTTQDAEAFKAEFYSHTRKIDQDNMIAQFLKVSLKHSTRKRSAATRRTRNSCETSFFVKKQSEEIVRVCKDFFLKMLSLGRTRVENIAKHCHQKGGLRTENRGGDRRTVLYGAERQAVHSFIKQLRGKESHHVRTKTKKLYLPSDVTSTKALWKMYMAQNGDKPVKYEFFRRIFKRDFHIGFGSPKTDACSMCERLKNQIKVEMDPVRKQQLMVELRIHKLRANAFCDLLNEKREGLKTFCFDHQQNQVLPKVPDQIAYYSRQLYVYNFSVVENGDNGTPSP